MKSRSGPVARRRPIKQGSYPDSQSDDPIGLLIGLHARQGSTLRGESSAVQPVPVNPAPSFNPKGPDDKEPTAPNIG